MSNIPDPTSFAARRSAASNLPSFHLPPPELSPGPRIPPFAPVAAVQPNPPNNILTPPSNVPSEVLSPLSSAGAHSGSSAASNGAVPSYTPNGFWPSNPTPPSPNSAMNATNAVQSAFSAHNAPFPGRSVFSPALNVGRNLSNSPAVGEGSLPAPPYELSGPPFPTSTALSSGTGLTGSSIPNLQQAQQITHALLGGNPAHASTQPPLGHIPDPYSAKPAAASHYLGTSQPSSAPPHQTTFPSSFNAPPPNQISPGSGGPNARVSPLSAGGVHPPPLHPAPGHSYARSMNYSLPAMPGPIMSNVHNPGSQMSLVGGLMSSYSSHPNLSSMYGGSPHGPPQQPNDRPFKCDQCPQSFNRNHDLKRHKRIHLAVKPFPCGHCDKSFSRKDALKRHILVKGCGNGKSNEADSKADGSISPPEKSDVLSSDDADESPVLPGSAAMKNSA